MSSSRRPVPQRTRRLRIRPLLALCLLGACVALAACGSSGSGSSSAANTSSTSTNKAGGQGSSRFTALRSCLQKQGITLPTPPSGAARRQQRAPGAGAPGRGSPGLQLPKGVTQAQFQAALKKCGGANFPRGGAGGLNSASARAGLAKFAACLRQNGIDVPAPNTTGNGPVFSTKGIDTSSSKFKTAQSKCKGELKGAFPGGARGDTPPTGAPNGTPPTGAAPPGVEGSAG